MDLDTPGSAPTQHDDEAIVQNWQRQLDGMDRADTGLLAAQFTPDAVLVHMTGHEASLQEWMQGIRDREFVYHRVVERGHGLQLDGDTAVLLGRITTGVTDDGSGQAWPLRCEQHFRRTPQGWRCTRSVVRFDSRG